MEIQSDEWSWFEIKISTQSSQSSLYKNKETI
jgi:hypothetical protein